MTVLLHITHQNYIHFLSLIQVSLSQLAFPQTCTNMELPTLCPLLQTAFFLPVISHVMCPPCCKKCHAILEDSWDTCPMKMLSRRVPTVYLLWALSSLAWTRIQHLSNQWFPHSLVNEMSFHRTVKIKLFVVHVAFVRIVIFGLTHSPVFKKYSFLAPILRGATYTQVRLILRQIRYIYN